MSELLNAKKTEDGIIIHENKGGEQRRYLGIRGGLSWPSPAEDLPGYFCILGEVQTDSMRFEKELRGRLFLIYEWAAPDVLVTTDVLISKIVNAVKLYKCDKFYTITDIEKGEDHRAESYLFRKHMHEMGGSCVLLDAPWLESVDTGVKFISQWLSSLVLPEESIIRNQLKGLASANMIDIPKRFAAINALRFVVCSFQRDQPHPGPVFDRSKTRWGRSGGTWRSL